VRNNPDGSFVTGVPVEAKLRATRSLRAWCLAVLPGALFIIIIKLITIIIITRHFPVRKLLKLC